ncbi:MAG: Lrp/AsnC family transcriptional regulator [Streptosporangiaceae bacterium]
MAVPLDEVDVELLSALQVDADRTNVELSRLVGLSPAATLNRVRWLKQSGVIRVISAQLDPEAAGFPLQMYVMAAVARHDPRSTRIFEDQVRALPQIITADNIAGEFDYLLSVVARDVGDLQQVLAALAARGGSRLITHLRLEEVKPPARLPLVATKPARERERDRNRDGGGQAPGGQPALPGSGPAAAPPAGRAGGGTGGRPGSRSPGQAPRR